MDFKVAKNAVTSRVARQVLIGRKHSPTILFAGGVVGVVGTTVLACRATLKMDEVLNAHDRDISLAKTLDHKDYSSKDRNKDLTLIKTRTAVRITKLYAPAVGLGVISVAALTGSHVVLTKRNVALTAAYSALDRGFNEYRQRVQDEFGAEKEEELRHGIREETVEVHDTKKGKVETSKISNIDGASIYARYFDESCRSWSRDPWKNQMFIQCQQNYANDILKSRGHLFLNEVYEMLGLDHTKEGAVVGWVLNNGDSYVDFGVFSNGVFRAKRFVNGDERSVLLDFNVDGVIFDLI